MPFVSEHDIYQIKSNLPKALGEAIRVERKNKNLSQTELAALTQKDRQYIYKIEKGKVTPNIVTVGIIAKALEISIAELLKDLGT
ncbi:helix-turn-helix domain-containing protein [Rasiella sp. SM2506]|uniref:helix-turn-helix domain-containing protein n=1 Tax=Rasiella sp. SM2506 TaxID=3423914 RepID=UPI003D79C423